MYNNIIILYLVNTLGLKSFFTGSSQNLAEYKVWSTAVFYKISLPSMRKAFLLMYQERQL